MYNLEEYVRYKYVIENIKDILWEMDANFTFTFVSCASKETSGYETEELIGRCMLDFLAPESKEHVRQQWERRISNNENFLKVILYDVQFVCKDKTKIWVEVSVKPMVKENKIVGYIGVTRDITVKKTYENELKKYIEELKYANKKLDELATFDMLTGAYNRRKFQAFVQISIEKKASFESPFSIIMFDIDFFKRINDSYGHDTGDRILQEITAVVKKELRDTDKIFRWGGEEFIILLPETSLKNTYNVAQKVRKSIEQNEFGIGTDFITISLGIGEYITKDSVEQFVSRVDNALLKAKSSGRNRVEFS